jgi:DamX protein
MDTDYDLEKDFLAEQEVNDPAGQYYSVPLPVLLPSQLKALELLSHLASYSELLVAVTGHEGSGKTVLASALAAQREEPETSLFLTGDLMLGMPAILNAIASHWDMSQLPEDMVAARDAIRAQAASREEQGESLLVIIDQAEQLDSETLNSIANFALIAPQALSFTLFGRAGFEDEIRQSPANAPVHRHEIEPLSRDDCQQLIQQVYSPGNALQLSSADIDYVFEQSRGWPADVLRYADDLFLNADAQVADNDNLPVQATRFPLTHILAIAAVAAALVMSFIYSGYHGASDDASVGVAESPLGTSAEDATSVQVESEALSTLEAETAVINPPVVAVEPDYNYVPTDAEVGEDLSAHTAEPAEQSPVLAVTEAPVETLADQVETLAEPVKAQSQGVKPVSVSPLLAVNSGFVVQLFGSYQQTSAERFAETWADKVAGTLYQYETIHQGKPWFVVVAGTYGSRDEAKAAVNAMPQVLRKQSPWIRDIAAVKEAIR